MVVIDLDSSALTISPKKEFSVDRSFRVGVVELLVRFWLADFLTLDFAWGGGETGALVFLR